uniref:Uncharacterized protein n=1 Tax=Anguilla anguilla TaxID=7936 RepID=A0A0E9WBC3_ANGAN
MDMPLYVFIIIIVSIRMFRTLGT